MFGEFLKPQPARGLLSKNGMSLPVSLCVLIQGKHKHSKNTRFVNLQKCCVFVCVES